MSPSDRQIHLPAAADGILLEPRSRHRAPNRAAADATADPQAASQRLYTALSVQRLAERSRGEFDFGPSNAAYRMPVS